MTDHKPSFDDVLEILVEAVEASTGFLNDRAIFQALAASEDVALARIELDSLSTFEIIMALEERLGLELDADQFSPDETLHGLARMLTSSLSGHDA